MKKGGRVKLEFISLLLSVAIAIYLALDAPKYEKNPWIWGIFGFLFGLITLGIYFIQTNRKTAGWLLIILSILYWTIIILMMLGLFVLYSL